LPSKSYFYKDDTGKIKKFIYCCLCGDGPYKETESNYNFYSVHGGASQNYCLPCARSLGLSLEDIKDKSTLVEKEEKIEEVFFTKSNINPDVLYDNTLESNDDIESEDQHNKDSTLGVPLLFSDPESNKKTIDEDKEESIDEDENDDILYHVKKSKRKILNPIKKSLPPSIDDTDEEEKEEEISVSHGLIDEIDEEEEEIPVTPGLIDEIEDEEKKVPTSPELIDIIEDEEEKEGIPVSSKLIDQIEDEEEIPVTIEKIKEEEEFSTPPGVIKEISELIKVIEKEEEIPIPVETIEEIEEDKGPFYVYVGEFIDGTYLTGITKDMKKEIKEINSGSNITSNKLPMEIVYYHIENKREDALRSSTHIMFMGNEEKEKIISKFSIEFFKK